MALNCSFAGKRILVTGGARGLGRAIVERLAKDNAVVSTIDRNEEALKELKSQLPQVNALAGDLGNWDETRKLVHSLGPLDHLVNNAGIITEIPFMNIKQEDFDQIFNVNLKAVINVSQVTVANMIQHKVPGTIVNVSSLSNFLAAKGLALYGGTKGALSNLTRTMALEFGRYGIRVNAICPAIMETDMFLKSPQAAAIMTQFIKMRGCIRQPVHTDDSTNLALFLLSPSSSMITGQSILVDGGVTTN